VLCKQPFLRNALQIGHGMTVQLLEIMLK
jgi:hypothetical protein